MYPDEPDYGYHDEVDDLEFALDNEGDEDACGDPDCKDCYPDDDFSPAVENSNTNPTQENNSTMQITKDITPEVVVPKKFNAVTITFTSEREYHDVVAALAAYGRKLSSVSGTSIPQDKGLTAYSGNARKTVNELLSRLP